MRLFRVYRALDTVVVAIMPHKDGSGYGFVNLTKGHICECRFPTVEDAIEDMRNNPDVQVFAEIKNKEEVMDLTIPGKEEEDGTGSDRGRPPSGNT